MEIALLPSEVLRIKGKKNTLFVNPTVKQQAPVAVLIGSGKHDTLPEDTVIIDGPGEYEIGGIRMLGVRAGQDTVYSLTVEGVDIMLGTLAAFEKGQSRLKEHQIVVVLTETVREASFVTSFASRVLMFYGEKAKPVVNSFEKEDVHTMQKYQTTVDKLPGEMEIVFLA